MILLWFDMILDGFYIKYLLTLSWHCRRSGASVTLGCRSNSELALLGQTKNKAFFASENGSRLVQVSGSGFACFSFVQSWIGNKAVRCWRDEIHWNPMFQSGTKMRLQRLKKVSKAKAQPAATQLQQCNFWRNFHDFCAFSTLILIQIHPNGQPCFCWLACGPTVQLRGTHARQRAFMSLLRVQLYHLCANMPSSRSELVHSHISQSTSLGSAKILFKLRCISWVLLVADFVSWVLFSYVFLLRSALPKLVKVPCVVLCVGLCGESPLGMLLGWPAECVL